MSDIPDPLAPVDAGLLRNQMEKALAGMSPRDRNLLVYRYHHQLPAHEIAICMGMPVGNVDIALERAGERFRKHMESVQHR